MTQSALANEVGCKQSALSMFEQGDGTKLNDDVINRLAKKFELELTMQNGNGVGQPSFSNPKLPATAYCPNLHCPSNQRYQVEDRVLYCPDRAKADPVGGKYCALCGELLERNCPNCGAPVHDGAICSICGEPYVAG